MDVLRMFIEYHKAGLEIQGNLLNLIVFPIPARVIRAWEEGRLLLPSWKNGEPERLWLNVVSHNTAVAVLTRRIALGIFSVNADELTEAALVHDWFKRRESEMISAAKATGMDPVQTNRNAEIQNAELLLGFGFSREVANLTRATGDIGLERMMEPDVSLAEQIIFYADSCVDGGRIVTYKERFDALLPHFKPGGRYDHVNAKFLEKYGRTHRSVYDSVVLPIQEKLARVIGIKNPETLPIVLKGRD